VAADYKVDVAFGQREYTYHGIAISQYSLVNGMGYVSSNGSQTLGDEKRKLGFGASNRFSRIALLSIALQRKFVFIPNNGIVVGIGKWLLLARFHRSLAFTSNPPNRCILLFAGCVAYIVGLSTKLDWAMAEIEDAIR
jgi:hypothetical protein